MGDALGMPFEGAVPEMPPVPLEMREARLGAGTYTDDTQMTIALAESLLACGEVEQAHLAETFLRHFDRRRGYGAGTIEVFSRWECGESVESAAGEAFGGQGSLGNGAAMRVAPIPVAFASDVHRMADQARQSAALTHRHRLGIEAAVAQAFAIAGALRGDDPLSAARSAAASNELGGLLDRAERLRADRPSSAEVAERLGNGSTGPESVPAAVYAATVHSSFEDAVTFAIRCGGDADTIGAMAGAIAGARFGASEIPSRWLSALEDGRRGRSHVEQLAEQLECFATISGSGMRRRS